MGATIGIKIANGEFYSLVEENSAVKKRLVLTTVHNKQRSVQIDLYRSFTKTMADAQYIGSLVVENIKAKSKGEPSIEMIIASTLEGDITAEAVDLEAAKGQRQSLNVSLKSLDEDNRDFDIPDFDLDQQETTPQGLYEKAEAIQQKKKRKPFPWLVVIIALLVLLIGGGIAVWYFVFDGELPGNFPRNLPWRGTASTPAQVSPALPDNTPVQPPQPLVAAEPALPPVSPPPAAPVPPPPVPPPQIIQAPAAPRPVVQVDRSRRVPPVASYKVPATIPREGVAYTIRWGDTLWDISEAFYRSPWYYPHIARFNNIRTPDFIISGRTIRIPPRN